MISITGINWLSVAVAFLVYFVLGALWFTALFSKPYRISLGKENEPPQKPAPIFIVGPALCTLVITVTSAILMTALHMQTYGEAFQFSMLVGFGYLVANTVNIAINPNIPRPILYGIISGSYHLVGITATCLIMSAW
jgi:hypothetical protein